MLVRFAPRECHPIVPRSPGEGNVGTSRGAHTACSTTGWVRGGGRGSKHWEGVCTSPFSSVRLMGCAGQGVQRILPLTYRNVLWRLSSQTSGIASAEIAQLQLNCLLREWGIGIRGEDVAISAGRATSSSMRSPTKRRRYDGHVDEPVEDAEEVSPSESAPDDQSASDGETRCAHAADLSPLLTRAMTVDMDLIPLVDVDLPDPQARLRSPRSTD